MEENHPHAMRSVLIALAVAVFLGILFDYSFHRQTLGLSFFVYVAFLVLGFVFLARQSNRPLGMTQILLLLGAIFFSGLVFIRSSSFLTFTNVTMTVYLLIMAAWSARGFNLWGKTIGDYIRPFIEVPFESISTAFTSSTEIRRHAARSEKRNLWLRLGRGVFFAIPVLVVFMLLFSAADLVFKERAADVLDLLTMESAGRLVAVSLVAFFLLGFFRFAVKQRRAEVEDSEEARVEDNSKTIEGLVVISLVNILFLFFLVVQFAYLFGGEGNLVMPGVTYAQYARRGFFELLSAALLAFLLIWTIAAHVFDRREGYPMLFKVLGGALIAQVLVIMVSAMQRLFLYEGAFGFTVLRFYAHTAIYWLALVLVMLAVKIVIDRRDQTFLAGALIVTVLFAAGINIINPDAFIARQNLKRYQKTGKLDVNYLSTLSQDATPSLMAVLQLPDDTGRRDFAGHLYRRRQSLMAAKRRTGWQSLSLSDERALAALNSQERFLRLNRKMELAPPAEYDPM